MPVTIEISGYPIEFPLTAAEARKMSYGWHVRVQEKYRQTICAATMYGNEGAPTMYQCRAVPGYGPEGLYCKRHTREHWPEMDISVRQKLPEREEKETPWMKRVFGEFKAWKTRKEWPVGSVLLRRNNNGIMNLPSGRGKIKFGLGTGTADLIGWKSVIVTPDMVGARIAIFASVEAKRNSGELGDLQQRWLDTVLLNGGVALQASPANEAEVLALLRAAGHGSVAQADS